MAALARPRFILTYNPMIEWIPVIAAEVAAEQGEHLGPISELAGQFGVNWKYLFAQIVNFCIVAFLLYKFAFKPVLSSIDERQKKIADGLQYAEEMKHKLADAEKQHKETLKEAQQNAQKIIAEARDTSKEIIDRQTQEAVVQAEDVLKKAQESVELEHTKMLSEVRSEIARLVVQTTAKVLRKDLSEEEKSNYSDSAAKELTRTES